MPGHKPHPVHKSHSPDWVYALTLLGDQWGSMLDRFAADHAAESREELTDDILHLEREIKSIKKQTNPIISEAGLARREEMLEFLKNLRGAKLQPPKKKVEIKLAAHPRIQPKPPVETPTDWEAIGRLEKRAAETVRRGLIEAIGNDPRVKEMADADKGVEDAEMKLTRLLDAARNDKSRYVPDAEFAALLNEYILNQHKLETLRQTLSDEYHADIELVIEASGVEGGMSPKIAETVGFVAERAANEFKEKYTRRPLRPPGVEDPGLKDLNKDASRVLRFERQAQLLGYTEHSSDISGVLDVGLKADRKRITIELEKLSIDIKDTAKPMTAEDVEKRTRNILMQAGANARQAQLLGKKSPDFNAFDQASKGNLDALADSLRNPPDVEDDGS